MKILKKINKGLILTIIVLVALITYLTNVEKQRESDKQDIRKVCEEYIALTDKYVVLPEDMQTFTGKISKENEERLKKQLREELEKQMINNEEAIEIQNGYLFDELKNGYRTENEVRTKNKRTITKISSYEFDGDQVTVTLRTTIETTYKYIEEITGTEKERQNTVSSTNDEIILQKVEGQWKVVYSNMQFDNSNNIYYTDSMIMY